MIKSAVDMLLDMGGGVAALFVARDSPNFGVVQGMMATIVLVSLVAVIALVLWRRRRND